MTSPPTRPDQSYAAVYDRMVSQAPRTTVYDADGNPSQPLANLNSESGQDFTLTLLSAWAIVADILSFYLDRIAEEGYIGSAVEAESIFYLASAIGYQAWPGVAASTWLTVTVASTAVPQDLNPATTVTIPAGTSLAVQNIPSQGNLPVLFEAEDQAEARVAWNQLTPSLPLRPVCQVVTKGTTGVRLGGAVTSLTAGSSLLLVTRTTQQFRVLQSVNIQRAKGYTAVTWAVPLDAPETAGEEVLAAYTFRQQAALFGSLAAPWESASDATRSITGTRSGGALAIAPNAPAWTSIQRDLPAGTTYALAATSPRGSASTLFAATAVGVYSTIFNASKGLSWTEGWKALPVGTIQQPFYTLCLNERGWLYAAGARGAVFCSKDLGQSWQSLRLPVALPPAAGSVWGWIKGIFTPKTAPPPTQAPAYSGTIRAIAAGNFGKSAFVFLGTDDGIFQLRDAGQLWQPFSDGLPGFNSDSGQSSTVVYALFLDPNSDSNPNQELLLAGTSSGMYSRKPSAKNWQLVPLPVSSSSSPQPAVFSVAIDRGVTLAGTDGGLFETGQIKPANGSGGPVPSGPPSGPSSGQIPSNCSVTSFAISNATGTGAIPVLAGTSAGVFRMEASGVWKAMNQQEIALFSVDNDFSGSLNKGEVPELLVQLFAANGVTLSSANLAAKPCGPPGGPGCWQIEDYLLRVNGPLLDVTAIVPLTSLDVRALAMDAAGNCFAACPTGPFLEQQWPGFQLTGGSVPLDRIASGAQAGDYAVFQSATPSLSTTVVATIKSQLQQPYQAFGRQATVTVLKLEPESQPDPKLGLLDPRSTTAYLKPASLALFVDQEPVVSIICGRTIQFTGTIDGLFAGHTLAITGKPACAILPPRLDPIAPSVLFSASASNCAELQLLTVAPALAASFQQNGIALSAPLVTIVEPEAVWIVYDTSAALGFLLKLNPDASSESALSVFSAPVYTIVSVYPTPEQTDSGHTNAVEWSLSNPTGTFRVTAPQAEIILCPSNPAALAIAEFVTLAVAAESNTCIFAQPMRNVYDPETVSVSANMVHATQGSTVNSEVLGNGDATLANQAFTLKRPPLTYVNDNRYSVQNSDGTIQKGGCTLQVFVSSNSGVPAPAAPILNPFTTAQQTPVGDLWTQVPTLFGTSPEDKVYTLATDSNGSSTVTFGDGVEGARLPTGYGNVAARYRTGLGPGGNLPANSLTVFRNRPAGVRAVTNPVPATGGIYAEAIDSMTSRMTFAARSIGRIVSLKDYQSFSLTQDDVIKARADLVKNGPVDTAQSEQVVWLTVGVRGDRAIAPDQATFLAIAIEAARVGRSTFQVAGFETVYFELSALITSDGTVETGVLKANVRAALVEAFSFDMRLFYQPVTAAEVVATMQGVAGVYEATLDLLYFTGDKPSRANSLPAREPRWSVAKNAILEAQLLIIDSATANDGVAIIATERPL